MAAKFETTHDRIMETAIALMGQYGLDQVSVELICENANIVRSTFYQHFKSIGELIREHFIVVEKLTPENVAWIFAAPTAYEKAIRVHLSFIHESLKPGRITLYQLNLKSYLENASP